MPQLYKTDRQFQGTNFRIKVKIAGFSPFLKGRSSRQGRIFRIFSRDGALPRGPSRACAALHLRWGASRTRPVPLCHFVTFPPHCGGIFPQTPLFCAAETTLFMRKGHAFQRVPFDLSLCSVNEILPYFSSCAKGRRKGGWGIPPTNRTIPSGNAFFICNGSKNIFSQNKPNPRRYGTIT